MDRANDTQSIDGYPYIEHIREFRAMTMERTTDHFCIGYVFRGECRITGDASASGAVAHTAYIIGRGTHSMEYIPGERGIFEQIIIHLDGGVPEYDTHLSDRELLRFERAVVSGLAANLSVDELAERCCISLSTFKRRFRQRYSMSPHQWLTQQRLELTRAAILTTTLSLCEIVEASGFVNMSHFISLFKRRYGITPARLRRRQRSSIE